MHPMSIMLLETFVLSKPYFEREGLILALDDDKPVGFIHAGFGPNAQLSKLSTDVGVICMLVVPEHPQRDRIQGELIQHSESYLRGKGAIDLRAGSVYPNSPFYLGLYGGSEIPGLLSSDLDGGQSFRQAGYEEIERHGMFQRSIEQFRPTVDRSIIQLRRQLKVRLAVESLTLPWWDACAFGPTDRVRFVLESKRGEEPLGEVSFWDLGPLSTRFGTPTMGMIGLSIKEEHHGKGFATFLVAECLQQLSKSNISLIHAQAKLNDDPTQKILNALGFEMKDYGIVFGK